MFYTLSMFVCSTSGVTALPQISYGAMWIVEEIEMTVKAKTSKLVLRKLWLTWEQTFSLHEIVRRGDIKLLEPVFF